jgi:small subunit ribosomal protein S6
MLLLSNDAPEEQRTRVLSYVESAIAQGGGQIERNDNWGRRPMAFQIRHQAEAEYHLLQFRAPGSIIEDLEHTLRITDGVLRVRIIKVRRGTPDAKGTPPPVVAAVAAGSGSSGPTDSSAPREPGPAENVTVAAESTASTAGAETTPTEADTAASDAAPAGTETAQADAQPAEGLAAPSPDQDAE